MRGAKRFEDEAQLHRRHGRQSSTKISYYELALAGDVRWGPFLQKHEEKSCPLVCDDVMRAACSFLGGGNVSLSASSTSDSSLACCCLTSHGCCMPHSLYLSSLTPATYNLLSHLSLRHRLPLHILSEATFRPSVLALTSLGSRLLVHRLVTRLLLALRRHVRPLLLWPPTPSVAACPPAHLLSPSYRGPISPPRVVRSQQ